MQIFANGSALATATIPLTGTVADGDVFVLAQVNAVAAILGQADQTTSNFLFNGDDAIVLRKTGTIVDVIGQIGSDPGTEWGSGTASTADNTLQRKATVQAGDPNGSDAFDPATQWDGFTLDTFSGLGSHSVSGGNPGGGGGALNAIDDAATLEEDDEATVIDVLANDSGSALTIVSATDPVNGAVSIAAGGSDVSYEPDVDFNGTDSFTYSVSDSSGQSDTATVTVTVSPVNDDPDPEDDAVSASEDTAVTVDVLANDDDVDGDSLSVSVVEGEGHGGATVAADGKHVSYVPDPDWNGVETLEYTVSDAHGGTNSAEIVLTVMPVNDPPTARADSATVGAGGSVVLDLLLNDLSGPADENGQTLVIASIGTPAHGAAQLLTSGADAGKVRYTPTLGYAGADSFSYVLSDGTATTTGNVSITVKTGTAKPPCSTPPTIVATLGNDVIEGTPGDDVIRARRGDDVIHGNGGNDVVCAGPGADTVTTGDGNDRIGAGTGNDTIDSGAGADLLRGGFGRDTLRAGEGNDTIAAGYGDDTAEAGNGRNRVTGGPGDDHLTAGSGNDRLDGGAGVDSCDADGGRNTILRCE